MNLTGPERAAVLGQMINSDNVRQRDHGVIANWLAENTEIPNVFEAAEALIQTQLNAGLLTFLASDVKHWDVKGSTHS